MSNSGSFFVFVLSVLSAVSQDLSIQGSCGVESVSCPRGKPKALDHVWVPEGEAPIHRTLTLPRASHAVFA